MGEALTGKPAGQIGQGRVRQHGCAPARVRRQGLEPRTRGLRVGCLAAPGVLPAQMPHANAQKAHIAQGYGRHSSHESSHGILGMGPGSVTVSDGDCPGRPRADPPSVRRYRPDRGSPSQCRAWAFCVTPGRR
jgi:hypothetical protein